MKHDIVSVERLSDLVPLTRSSTCARRPSLPRTTSPARSTARCSTTSSASKSAPCTSRSPPSPPGRWARHVSENIAGHLRSRFLDASEALATLGRLLAWRPAQRLADLRPAAHRLGCAATRRRLQDLSPAGHRESRPSSRATAAPGDLWRHRQRQEPHPAGHRARSASRSSTSRNWPVTRARCWASCRTARNPRRKCSSRAC
jgi:hypothetical protein